MAEQPVRMQYFDKQFLREKEFTDEQIYHLEHQRDHTRLLHTPGIAEGLDVPDPDADATSISVYAGYAYDALGRRIVLANNIDKFELASLPAGQSAYITVKYDAEDFAWTDETGAKGATRKREIAVVEALAFAPPNEPVLSDEKLVLARVDRNGVKIAKVDRSKRRAAGMKGGDLEALSVTFASDKIASTGWVTTRLEKAKGAMVDGSVRVVGNLEVTGTITGDIAVNTIQSGDIVDNAIRANHVQDGAITKAKLAAGSVDGTKLIEGCVGSTQLAANGVTTVKLVDGAVTSAKLGAADGTSAQDTKSGSGVKTGHIQDEAITLQKLASAVRPIVSINSIGSPGGNVNLVARDAVTVVADANAKSVSIGESHSSRTNNPHSVTAQQIDSQGGANRLVTQINSGTGVISEARLDPGLARTSAVAEKLSGAIVQGAVTIPGTSGVNAVKVTVTRANLLNCLVTVRGWASTVPGGAPGLVAAGNTLKMWSPLPQNFREGWALPLSGTVSGPGFFTFNEGNVTFSVQLNAGDTGAYFYLQGSAGTVIGYGFHFTWQ